MTTTGYRPAEEIARQGTCTICNGRERVCENHPNKAWPKECDCGAGMPCVCSPLHKQQPKQEQNAVNADQFIEDAAFAKQVDTKDGPALRIGSHILHVTGPEGTDWIALLAKALRTRHTTTGAGYERMTSGDPPGSCDTRYTFPSGAFKCAGHSLEDATQESLQAAMKRAEGNDDPACVIPYRVNTTRTERGIEALKSYAKRWTREKT